jgi:hypothetical protein
MPRFRVDKPAINRKCYFSEVFFGSQSRVRNAWPAAGTIRTIATGEKGLKAKNRCLTSIQSALQSVAAGGCPLPSDRSIKAPSSTLALPECHSRRAVPRSKRAFCAHPFSISPGSLVTTTDCAACGLWRDAPPLRFIEPPFSPNVVSWSVGVTTAPRRVPTLGSTLASLQSAGWDCPRLFVEPGTKIPSRFAHLSQSVRDQPLGAFPNWYLGLAELVMRDPRCDAYMMVQDDVLFARNIRAFLETALWPSPDCGCVSIFCPSHYAVGCAPGFHLEDRGWRTWGALALIFPNPSARALVGSPAPVCHRHHGPRGGSRNIDSLVGAWCRQAGRPFYTFAPSLAEHHGQTSTLYHAATASGRRVSRTFVGETADVAGELAGRWTLSRDSESNGPAVAAPINNRAE